MTHRLLTLMLALGLLAAPLPAEAQQAGKVYRIGWLGFGSPTTLLPLAEPFRRRLHELGYVEGQNLVFEYRWGEGRPERLPALVSELVRLKVDLIVAAVT